MCFSNICFGAFGRARVELTLHVKGARSEVIALASREKDSEDWIERREECRLAPGRSTSLILYHKAGFVDDRLDFRSRD